MNSQEIIGRGEQLQRLQAYYDKMLSGKSQLCFVTGVAGSGKTYLVEHFLCTCVDQDQVVIAKGACNKHAGSAEAYFPFLEIIKSLSTVTNQCKKYSKNQRGIAFKGYAKVFADVLMDQAPDLLGTFIPGGSTVIKTIKKAYEDVNSASNLEELLAKNVGLSSTIDTNKIQFQIAQILRVLSEKFPLVLSIDDLHWSDDESLNLLYFLARKLEDCRVMIICSYRRNDLLENRDERHPFISMANELRRYLGDIWIDLDNIQEQDRERFTQELLDAKSNDFTKEFYQAFYQHTNGHPLFAVELLRHFIENGLIYKNEANRWEAGDKLEWSKLSPKVEGIIEERIGRLDDELRDILSISSVEGYTFSVSVVAHILNIQERQLLKLLSTELEKKHYLVEEGDTKKVGDCWLTHYRFVHGLFQQHLYNALSIRERMIAHEDIAKALLAIYGDNNDEVAAVLAYHFDMGGSAEKALPFYLKAGKRLSLLCAYPHAIRLFKRGLKIVESLDGEESRHIELDLMIQYGIALKALKGWDHEEVLDVLLEASEIAEELCEGSKMGPALFSLWGGFLIKLELDQATDIAHRMERLGDQTGDEILSMQAHLALSDTLFWTGHFEEGLMHNDLFYGLCDNEKQNEMIARYGQDSTVFADMYEMLHCSMLGRYSRVEQRLSRLSRAIKRMKHPYTQAIGYVSLAWGSFHLERFNEMDQFAIKLIELSTKNDFDYYLGYGQLFRAVTMAQEGNHKDGLALLDEAVARLSSGHKAWLYQSLYGVIKSQILYDQGAYESIVDVTSNIGSISLEKKDVCYMPELMRLQSMAYQQLGNFDKADEILQSAIEMARKINANVFFLRAAAEQVLRQKEKGETMAKSILEEAIARIDDSEPCPDLKRVQILQE